MPLIQPMLFTVKRFKASMLIVWIILLLGLWLRLSFVAQVQVPLKSDMASFHARGQLLAEQGQFGTGSETAFLNASTYRPPLYPLFLAGIYKISQPNPKNVYWAQCALSALMLVGIFQLAKQCAPKAIQQPVALTAMASAAIYPPLIGYCGILLSETLFMTLLVWAVATLLQPTPSRKQLLLTGVLFGLANLTRPITLPLMLLLMAVSICYRKFNLKAMATLLMAFLITLAPWVIRNYLEFHQFVLVDNSSGINMVAGNNDQGKGDYTRGYEKSWMFQDALRKSRNIVELDKNLLANDSQWIQRHPAQYAKLFFKRVGYYFVSEHEFYAHEYHWNHIPWHKTEWNLAFRLTWQILALLTLIGCLWLRYANGVLLGAAGFFFYLFPAIALYYTRYRHPGIPFVLILGALGFWAGISHMYRLWNTKSLAR